MIEAMGIKYERWHVGIHAEIEDNNFSTRIRSESIDTWIKVLNGDIKDKQRIDRDISIIWHPDHVEITYFRYNPSRYGSHDTYTLRIPQSMCKQIADDLQDMRDDPTRQKMQSHIDAYMKSIGTQNG